jgi:hypothetical protein
MYKYCIIGFGISGQLLAMELLKTIPSENIIICDETFLGGDLAVKYGSVLSNTPWWKTKKALEQYNEPLPNIPENDCTPVRIIAKTCLKTALNKAINVEKLTTIVSALEYESSWKITHTFGTFNASTVFLCCGGIENKLDIPIPQIPSNVALDKEQLKNHISSDTIALFGTSHTGTIILENLNFLSTPTFAIYKGSPFRFEPESYDGLKEHSAEVAKSILNGEHINTTLVPWSDPLAVHKSLQKATKAIIATGFKPRMINPTCKEYDPMTAKLSAGPNLYGFGMAYPSTTQKEKIYYDIGVLSFQEQIQRCLPGILETNTTDR